MSSRGNFKGSTSARYVKNKRQNSPNNDSRKDPQFQKNFNDFSGNRNNDNSSKFDDIANEKMKQVREINRIDAVFGFDKYESGPKRTGWLVNMHPTLIQDDESHEQLSGVDYYFLDEEGGSFKVSYQFDPYFLLVCPQNKSTELEEWLRRSLEGSVKTISTVEKEDLDLANHLTGKKATLVKLSFNNITDLLNSRRILQPYITKNKANKESNDIYKSMNLNYNSINKETIENDDLLMDIDIEEENDFKYSDASELILDIKEYDVPYHVRVSIDDDIRIGKWYIVEATSAGPKIIENKEKIAFADPVVLAFDIETTKAPLKFPDSAIDQIMMISYMIDGEGYLITNRSIISEDIQDFEYTPKPEYVGEFTIFNEPDEKALIEKFFEHVRDVRPTVIATFNGDFFDWPFVEARASFHGIDMFKEIGFSKDAEGEYKSTYCAHMDCFRWVKRDSYLPQGSQGLKAVTTAKLGYNPTELDPELMTPYAYEHPQLLSEYSVSDAVATYYLYYKYVHPFIFSLCTIIPLNPDEVLRKGTGTLCEMLLMVQAYNENIVLPNKHMDPPERFYNGHLLESETYVGGHVESLEAGVFRSDLNYDFTIDPTAVDEVIADLKNSLTFAIVVEGGKKIEDVTNFQEVHDEIKEKLLLLKEKIKRNEPPLIYHVDVASMYPNIMTTNRLQPDSMKSEEDCASCDFNRPGKKCDRRLTWAWRGEYYPAEMNEYNMIKNAAYSESFPAKYPNGPKRKFDDLPYPDQVSHIKKKIADYSRKVYHRIKCTETVEREAIVCQRENPFYVNTVRNFRDRRYDFKGLAKVWKGKVKAIDSSDKHAIEEATKMVVLYDSLQLAHKVILNSFYGYVMRKGSRWYSMEMAGITCLTGATIIQMARQLVQRFGRPLEIDTDGIWCILPSSFPEEYNFELKNGKTFNGSYPCSMLNYLVHEKFTNHQYQTLTDPEKFKYEVKSDNSIFFEVDGPYKAMVLPTSKEEGKGLKKRYAVFNFDGSLAELKGFELKRRGELQLIKNFQSDIFKLFLEGDSLEGCYQTVANVANRWLDVLDTKGKMLEDEDLIELICENRSMSKKLEEYGNQKSTSITTAKRLGEFLGEEMVKDAGLACKYVIAQKPIGSPVTERAIPTTIFSSEADVKSKYLRRWLRDPSLTNFDPRTIIDWDYYRERLASVVQKIITIPAALQGVRNPVPRVAHPDWLQRKINIGDDKMKQSSLNKFFKVAPKGSKPIMPANDIEDIGITTGGRGQKIAKVTSKKRRMKETTDLDEEEQRILNGKMPNPLVDYPGFLIHQKIKWKIKAKERERREKIFGRGNMSTSSSFAMNNMLKNQAESYLNSIWQVIEYKYDKTHPDKLKAFVLLNGKLQTIHINILKKIYVNFKSNKEFPKDQIDLCEVQKTNSILPTGSSEKNVYKLIMPHHIYSEEMKKTDSILKSPDVEGIYEAHIDGSERAIMDLGTCVKFDDSKAQNIMKSFEKGFDQNDLRLLQPDGYLSKFSMGVLYILHIVSNSYEIFTLLNAAEKTAFVYILKPSNGAQHLPSNFESVYKDIYQEKKEIVDQLYNIIDYSPELDFEIKYFTDVSKIYKALNAKLVNISSNSASKMLLVIQSHIASKLKQMFKISIDLPTIIMGISEIQVQALTWHSVIIKRIMNHYLSLSTWLKKLMQLSRYTNVPFCNLNVDNIGYLIDINYSRRLSNNNIILWWSPNSDPDYGGYEKENFLSSIEESLKFPVFNRPEIYDTVCLEFSVKNLTVNTILSSSLINEAEGVFIAENGDNQNSTFADNSFSGPALSVLRSMIQGWWDDAIKDISEADALISSLLKWCSSPSSFLYNSSLHYHIHNLTKKSMVQLLNEFKRMGSSIVFADRNKIIVKTNKTIVENSYAYGQYVISSVRSKPLFNLLELIVVRYWDLLVWMDKYNFSGSFTWDVDEPDNQIEEINNGEDKENGETENHDKHREKLEYVSKWQIKNYLPIILHEEFEDWVLMILDSLIKDRKKQYAHASNAGIQARQTQITQILMQQKNQETEVDIEKISKEGLCSNFRKPLLKRINVLIKKQIDVMRDPEMAKEYEFPVLAGSHLKLSNPTLELVKYLCQILSLSRRRNMEVRMLRRDLLKLFGIMEFSEEGIFKNPSTSLVISELICDACYQIRDIDLCKDDENVLWNCPNCQKEYNKLIIEEHLIFEFNKLMVQYFTQDLKCNKCGNMRSDELSKFCECSGKWVNTITVKDLDKKFKIFMNVSDAYQFGLLRQVVSEVI
ncbi:DNA polymerase epsilon catalytic subunit [Pichia californica]|uniref:DNA polymerase epsilon catalytic subunit n=1 Tax=Pichia californica TaxID=460514 RepID=A0A9P6WP68_9ASCO|nr:DNA polymerase epsilon catalytic subunit [[Candida] californica]